MILVRKFVTFNKFYITLSLATTVKFNHSAYSINEDSGPLQPVLVLSNPSSTDITVEVFNTNISAIGKCMYLYI